MFFDYSTLKEQYLKSFEAFERKTNYKDTNMVLSNFVGCSISLLEFYQVYISIMPELYETGVNYNVQIWYYDKAGKIEGTGMYGDNNEYPNYTHAMSFALNTAYEILESQLP